MSRFARINWLDLALQQLACDGPEALKLDEICLAAGRTKGSFYHHFKDHDEFLNAVIQHWTDRHTNDLLAGFDPDQIGDDELEALFQRSMALDFKLELAIRDLSNRIPSLRPKVRETDDIRLTFTRQVYAARYDISDQTAENLALLDYAAFAGLLLMFPEITKERQIEVYRTFETLLAKAFGKVLT